MNWMNELDLQMTIGKLNVAEKNQIPEWMRAEKIYLCEKEKNLLKDKGFNLPARFKHSVKNTV